MTVPSIRPGPSAATTLKAGCRAHELRTAATNSQARILVFIVTFCHSFT
jgi:hypothetical protein